MTVSGTFFSRALTTANLTVNTDLDLGAFKVKTNHIAESTTSHTVTVDHPQAGLYKMLVRTVIVTGSANHTTGAKTIRALVRVQGGGGGGGGAAATADVAHGGGGGGGGYAEKWFTVAPSTAYPYAVGAAGTGGVGAADGVAGGNTTFTVDGTVLTGAGGAGGPQGVASKYYSVGGAAGGAGSNGDYNEAGQYGGGCVSVAAHTAIATAMGGDSHLGRGGAAQVKISSSPCAINGLAGTGYGGGGSGASMSNTGAGGTATGGAGAIGCIIVEEYGL